MWFIYALLSAGANTLANVARRIKGRNSDPVVLAWLIELATIPFAIVIFMLDKSPFHVAAHFWLPATGAAVLTTVTAVMLIKAYQMSEVSYVSPLLNLLPVFLLISSYYMLGEKPELIGIIGVVVIVCGAYYINTDHRHKKLLDPFRRLAHDQGARLVIGTTLIWAISTNLDKIAIEFAPVSFLVLYLYTVISLLLGSYVLLFKRSKIRPTWRSHGFAIVLVAIGSVLTLYFQTLAIQGVFVSYALAVKRIDVLLTVLVSSVLYGEHERLKRIGGAFVMVLGVAVVYLLT